MMTTRRFAKIAWNNTKSYSSLVKSKRLNTNQPWTKLLWKNQKDGSLIKIRVQDMSLDLFEKLWELNVNYFMKEEFFIKMSGITEDAEALQEYKDILLESFKNQAHNTLIYLVDDDRNSDIEIVAISMMKLITSKNDIDYNLQVNTKPLKKYMEILATLNQLLSIEDVMKLYNVDCYYEDIGLAIHPKYRMLGISKYAKIIREWQCKEHNVPLTTAWCTTLGGQKILQDWDTVFEISYEKLGTLLNIDFKDAPPTCKYMATKIY